MLIITIYGYVMAPLPIIIIAIIALAYPLVKALLLRSTQDVRERLLKVGEKILTDPDVNEEHKRLVSAMLDDALDWRYMAFVVITLPKVVLLFLLGKNPRKNISAEDKAFMVREDVDQFYKYHLQSTMAVSPFFTLVFVAEVLVFALFLIFGASFFALAQLRIEVAERVTPKISNRNQNRRATAH